VRAVSHVQREASDRVATDRVADGGSVVSVPDVPRDGAAKVRELFGFRIFVDASASTCIIKSSR